MGASKRFDLHLERLLGGLGHLDRHAGLKGYWTGLMPSRAGKRVESMAARIDPMRASGHVLAKAKWSDREMLRRVFQWVVAHVDCCRGGWWILDDTGLAKKGMHSAGEPAHIARFWASRTTA